MTCYNRTVLLFLSVTLWCPFTAAAATASALPARVDTARRAGASRPFFISARLATDKAGQIQWSAFSEYDQIALKAELAQRERAAHGSTQGAGANAPCDTRFVTFTHLGRPYGSWDELVTGAAAVFRGRVVATTPGFEVTVPKTLLSVRVDEKLRGGADFPATGSIHVLYPAADFTIGGVRFCNAGPMGSFVPAVGDDVLVFTYEKPVDDQGTFMITVPQQLIFSRDHKLIAMPEIARGRESASLEELDQAFRRANTERRERQP
jgi:hypothetical protein